MPTNSSCSSFWGLLLLHPRMQRMRKSFEKKGTGETQVRFGLKGGGGQGGPGKVPTSPKQKRVGEEFVRQNACEANWRHRQILSINRHCSSKRNRRKIAQAFVLSKKVCKHASGPFLVDERYHESLRRDSLCKMEVKAPKAQRVKLKPESAWPTGFIRFL